MREKMTILVVSSEAVPFAKTGGLADVAGALPGALRELGHEVILVIPRYRCTNGSRFGISKVIDDLAVPVGDRTVSATIYESELPSGVKTYLVGHNPYFDRDELYQTALGDYHDNAERFLFFSRAVLEMLPVLKLQPDIIHLNDWQSAPVAVYLKTLYAGQRYYQAMATLFTIHNIAYQGAFSYDEFPLTNFPEETWSIDGLEYYGKMNFLKAGIVYADLISTVSAKYAREIQTGAYGCGMEGILVKRKRDLHGILNGVDYSVWSPDIDPLIPAHYDAADPSGKLECRAHLLGELGFSPQDRRPILGLISRLTAQKGLDLLADIMPDLLQLEVILVVLGTGDRHYQELLANLTDRYPQRVSATIGFDNALAHRIEAGSDIFLMPSRYEPCGLNQMYSLRYGTIPVVRATGGLDDTIQDYVSDGGKGNGFKFQEYRAHDFYKALVRAIDLYHYPAKWRTLMIRGMKSDFSWQQAARSYEAVYRRALEIATLRLEA